MPQKLKIGFIFTNFPIPGALFMYDKVTGMIDLGHEVHIFAFQPPNEKFKLHKDVEQYDLLSLTHYHGTPPKEKALKQLFKNAFSNPILFFKQMKEAWVVKKINTRGWLSSYFFLKTFEKHQNFDVFFVFSGPTANNVLYLKTLFPKAKLVTNFYGFDFSARLRKQGTDIYKRLWPATDLVITQSHYSKDILVALDCPEEKIIKHPLGTYADQFAATAGTKKTDASLNFISVSRLTEKKGHRIALSAFEKVLQAGIPLTYHIVGSGEKAFQEQIFSQIENSPLLKENVVLHGYKTRDELKALLDQCHVFIQPSVSTLRWAGQEDTPTAILEAQAMGLPVISTYHAGIPEIVIHEKTGLLVPEHNIPAVAEAIKWFIASPAKIPEMGKCARDFIKNNFDNKVLNQKLSETMYSITQRNI